MKKAKIIGLVAMWIVAMAVLCLHVTLARDNQFAIQPNWLSGSDRCVFRACALEGDIGFPIKIPSELVAGPYKVAIAINIAFAAAVGGLLALLLVKKRKYGVALGLAIIFGPLLFSIILH